jgi:hypothetical protein
MYVTKVTFHTSEKQIIYSVVLEQLDVCMKTQPVKNKAKLDKNKNHNLRDYFYNLGPRKTSLEK